MKATPFVITLLVIFTTVHAEQHEQHPDHHKREQLGFFGSRGRRSIPNEAAADPTMTTETESETSSDPVKQISELRQAFMGLQRNIRAPKGFFGMRGKKSYDNMDLDKRAVFQQNMNALRERARFIEPTFDELSYQSIKRAPSQGFFGVRGKKFGDYDLGYNYNALLSEKRAPSGFVGMRGKKSSVDMFDDSEIDDPQVFDYNYHEKRAPSGFLGVRGKKLYEFAQQQQPSNFMYR